MPLSFDPSRHPRDRRGRFTKSRSVLASAKDKKLVKDITGAFTPAQTGDGKAYAAKISDPGQSNAAQAFAPDAKAINEDLRAGHADAQGVKPMDDAMRPLPEDVVLHRSVPAEAFGDIDPASLQGMKVRDAGYSATQLDVHDPAEDDVRMFIAAPKGSKAVVNPDTGEVYLDRDSEMVVSRVEANSAGGHDMYLTLLPKTGGDQAAPKPAPDAAKPGHTEPTSQTDKPQGEPEFRAQLMKQKVPELQAQMRERGLKPGRKRKSELVDALVGDEMGHDGDKADRPAKPDRPTTADKPASPKPAGPPARDRPVPAEPATAEPSTASVEDRIKNAVQDELAAHGEKPGLSSWVSIAEVRKRLPDVTKAEFDAAANRLATSDPDINLAPEANQKSLTDEQRAGAVSRGNQDKHLIALAKPVTSSKRSKHVKAAAADPHATLLQDQWEQARDDLLKAWPKTAQPLVDELAGQAQAAARAGDLSKLGGLEASAGVISALASPLSASGSKLARLAAAGVVAEAADAKVPITAPAGAGAERVRQTADAVAQIIARGYASGAARASLHLAGADPVEVKAEVERQLGELGQSQGGLVGDNVGALLSAAQHAGRLAVLEQHPAKSITAVEVNDSHRCEPCAEADGHVYPTLRAALKDYPAAGNRSCLGGSRCRGFLRPTW